jgi:hypothetical protein
VGSVVGALVGVAVVGALVGAAVVGALVGAAVVGALVGAAVGAAVTAMHSDWPIRPVVQVSAAQSWQRWYVSLSWYFPDGHWKQLVCASHNWYSPAAHSLHAVLELGWYLPTGQSVHDAAPVPAYWPSSHVTHWTALYTLEYVPGVQ